MKLLLLSIYMCISFLTNGQNLVKNYSFEEGASCDGTTENINKVNNWSALTGNPKFINVNCPLSKNSRSYIQGMKLPPASEGGVLAGIGIAKKGEYLQGELISQLEKDIQYVVKIRVRLPIKFCNTFINEVGIVLSPDTLIKTKEYTSIDIPALALQNNTQSAITKQYEWEELSALYTATGDEKYIAIGNFSNINQGLFDNRTEKECTYLFLDVVSVEKFKEISITPFSKNIAIQKNATYLMEGISFEPASDILKTSSEKSLKNLIAFLKQNDNLKVELSCHTDNTLDAMIGKQLTEAQAKSLLHKLVDLGVAISQVKTIGKGSSKSIALNNTEKGRQKNNRIELKIINF